MTYDIISTRTYKSPVCREPQHVYRFLNKRYAKLQQETFFVCCLNGAYKITAVKLLTRGLVNKTLITPREVFREAIKENSVAVILAHNHPSGDCEPSDNDIKTTERIVSAGKLTGIIVLDHIIFSKDEYKSLAESMGVLFD